MWSNIALIILFILLNGLFAAAEIAVVTSRRSRIRQLAEQGNKSAMIIERFKEEPDKFLATIQIAITLVSVLASAIAGAMAVQILKPVISELPVKFIASSSEAIAIGIVTILITFFTLVFGELIPKSIALSHPESVGLRIAVIVDSFSKIANIFVKLLTSSTNLLLKPFGGKTFTERAFVSEEEVRMLIKEGGEQGVFEPTEQELIHSVFEFTDMSARDVMVPYTKIVSVSVNMSPDEIKSIITEEQFSRYPVAGKDLNDIRGILYVKDFLNALASGGEVDIRRLLKTPFFIPDTIKISTLLREMQKRRVHMALVIDEHGGVSGLVTMEDLIEEIVGEIRDEYDVETPVIQLIDGTMIIDSSISIRDLYEDYKIEIPESDDYETLGGFLLNALQRMPKTGDVVEIEGKRITVSEMVGQRIAKVRMQLVKQEESEI